MHILYGAVLLAIVVAERTGDVDVFVCVCLLVRCVGYLAHTHARTHSHIRIDVCVCARLMQITKYNGHIFVHEARVRRRRKICAFFMTVEYICDI